MFGKIMARMGWFPRLGSRTALMLKVVPVPRFLCRRIKWSDYELRYANHRATPRSFYVRSAGGVMRHWTLHPTKGWRCNRAAEWR